jgi:hypothetical protein
MDDFSYVNVSDSCVKFGDIDHLYVSDLNSCSSPSTLGSTPHSNQCTERAIMSTAKLTAETKVIKHAMKDLNFAAQKRPYCLCWKH